MTTQRYSQIAEAGRRAIGQLCAVSLGLWWMAGSVAWAQTSQPTTDALAEIVVTGSRIARTDLDAASPVINVSAKDLQLRGPSTLDTVVNELPQLAPTDGRQAGFENRDATLKADLRGLDPVRTLVLVNGRRFMPASGDGLVDLGTIPTAMVKRVDVLTGGASSVYGSDAIAGAINFVLLDDFEGLQIQASHGATFQGDGKSTDFSVLAGTNFAQDRGNIMVSARRYEGGEVLQGARKFSRVPYDYTNSGQRVQVGSSAVPGGFLPGGGYAGVAATTCPSGSSPAGVLFQQGGVPGAFCYPADLYNYAPYIDLLRPFHQNQLSSIFHYDLNDRVTAFGEFFFTNASTDWQVGPDGKVLRNVTVNDYLNNPVITDATRAFLQANAAVFDPQGTGNAVLPQLRVRFTDVGNRNYEVDRNGYSLTGGFRGLLGSGDHEWKWDVYAAAQRTTTDKRNSNVTLLSRLAAGLDASVVNGVATCANAAIFPDCTPINLFGENSLTPEQAAWLAPTFVDTSEFRRTDIGASLTGNLFNLPGGPVATAVGFEYRKDSFQSNPSPESASGDSGISSGPPVAGAYDVTEAFVEAGVPLVADRLNLELGGRASDYSLGGVGTPLTYKIGLTFKATQWLRLRGAYNRAVRAPNLSELYSPNSISFQSVADPCDSRTSPSDAVKALCVAQGVSASAIDGFTQLEQGAYVKSGGNPNLHEETADSVTFGAVISPVDTNLNLQIDYYLIKVKDAIGVTDQQTIVDNCFASLDVNDVFCQQITRDNIGQIYTVTANQLNLAQRKVSGLDVTADYAVDAPWLNPMHANSTLTFGLYAGVQFENKTTAYRGAETVDCAGYFLGPCSGFGNPSVPKTRLLGRIRWDNGPLMSEVRVRWISEMKLLPGVTFGLKKINPVTYVDLNMAYELSDRVRVNVGVQNLFNKLPQPVSAFQVNDSNADPALYDEIGARYFVGLTARL